MRIEGQGPEEALRGAAARGRCGRGRETPRGGLAGVVGVVVEVGRVEFEVFLEIGVAEVALGRRTVSDDGRGRSL